MREQIRVRAIVIMLAAGAILAGSADAASAQAHEPGVRGAVTGHVVVISIDGLRPDVIERYEARVLQRLLREGAYTLTAETVVPSKTLPSHTSMLTGVTPAVHGITWNTDRTDRQGVVGVPTIFELAKAQGFTTAAFFSKAKLRHLQKAGTLDHAQAPRGLNVFTATRTIDDATRYMRMRRPNLLFVHVAEPDAAGHSFGWLSGAYRMAVRRADAAVGQILRAANATYGAEGYTVIVTADHGGHGRDHGSEQGDDMQIPWIAWGAGVAPGRITQEVRTMDTAATVLWLLGVREPVVFEGSSVVAAFAPSARQLARQARLAAP